MQHQSAPAEKRSDGMRRQRVLYAALIIIVIMLGLSTRRYGGTLLAPWFAKAAGDTLWALCVYLAYGLLRPSASSGTLALGALLFSFAIEFSELYHARWIDTLRGYRLGGLILGFTFHWINLLYYVIGIGVGVLAERCYQVRLSHPPPGPRGSDAGIDEKSAR